MHSFSYSFLFFLSFVVKETGLASGFLMHTIQLAYLAVLLFMAFRDSYLQTCLAWVLLVSMLAAQQSNQKMARGEPIES